MKIFMKIVVVFFAIVSNGVYANDSIARVGAGGLELLKTDNIQMVSEILEISTAKIKVTYHFLNTSNSDIKTTVAFPMPAFNGERRAIGGEENQRPLESFHIYVNGASVPVQKNRVFFINNIDVTDKLRKIGLSDDQIFDPLFACMYGASSQAISSVCKMTEGQFLAIRNMHSNRGQIQETAYWKQTFPAGKEIEVVHEYQPFVSSGGNGEYSVDKMDMDRLRKNGVEACLDDKTYKALLKRRDKRTLEQFGELGDYRVPITSQEVEYILGTGRNWKGPIKSFKLILRKEFPDDIVSLCFPGAAKKTSPTTLEFSQSDFVPQDKLIIFFFH